MIWSEEQCHMQSKGTKKGYTVKARDSFTFPNEIH